MKIGFYLVWEKKTLYYKLAEIMIASAKKCMPNVEIVQLSDEFSAKTAGADSIIRQPTDTLSMLRSSLYAAAHATAHEKANDDWLFVDTDIVFKSSVEDIFNHTFEIAIADRNWPHQPVPEAFAKIMPYNAGVVFSRCQKFWGDVHELVKKSKDTNGSWYGDQKAICDVIAADQYLTMELPGLEFNYPPASTEDNAEGASIVHCKGNRKEWMLSREISICA